MHYYHGSDKLFDKFDLKCAGNGMNLATTDVTWYNHRTIHLTPHKEYAKNCAKFLKDRNNSPKGYLYKVAVKGQEDVVYIEGMLNICFNAAELLTIVTVEEI